MAETSKNKIYYNDNEDSIADVLEDMKKLAESTDNAIEKAKYNDTELKNKNTVQDEEIAQLKEKNTTQDSLIEQLQTKVVELETENTSLKNQIPSGEATGNPIHLSDSSDLECEIVPIGGAEQETEVDIMDNTWEQGAIEADTGADLNSTIAVRTKNYIPVYPNVEYRIARSVSTAYMVYFFYDKDKNFIGRSSAENNSSDLSTYNMQAGNSEQTITILNTSVAYMRIDDFSNSLDTVYAIKTNAVNPNYPSEIVTVGQNVNMIDITTLTKGYVTSYGAISDASNMGEMKSDFIKAEPNTEYTFKIIETNVTNEHWIGIGEYSSNNTSNFIKRNTATAINEITFTTSSTTKYLIVSARNLVNATKILLKEGNTEITYSPYGQGSVEIKVDNGLETTDTNYQSYTKVLPIQKEFVKIGDVEDTFVKVDGKWYEAHYHPKIVFDGTENFEIATSSVTNISAFLLSNKITDNSTTNLRAYCNRFTVYANENWHQMPNNSIILGRDTRHQVLIRYDDITTVDDFKAKLANWYEAGQPLTGYYILATPELLECTAEQESILNSFYTYKGITNISVDGIGTLKVNYKKDLETIINNLSATSVAE